MLMIIRPKELAIKKESLTPTEAKYLKTTLFPAIDDEIVITETNVVYTLNGMRSDLFRVLEEITKKFDIELI